MPKVCLSTLNSVTSRQVFEAARSHMLLLKLAKTSGSYKYRLAVPGSNEVLCDPIGALMEDSEYRAEFEGCPWYDLVERGVVPQAHWKLLDDLQFIHDMLPTNEWEKHLRLVEANVDDTFDWTRYRRVFSRK